MTKEPWAEAARVIEAAQAERHAHQRRIRILVWLLFLTAVGLGLALWAILLWRL